MPRRYEFGSTDEAAHPNTMRATLAEFLSTFVFVFAAEGSLLAIDKMHSVKVLAGSPNLVMTALATAFSFFAASAAATNISGGHVNPAISFGVLVGGRLSLIRAIFYWLAQILGAVLASLLLRFSTDGMRPDGFDVASGVGIWNALLMEIVLTFGLIYTYYATSLDPNRGHLGTIAPLAVALMYGANVLVGGPFSGASMNPARAFGPALVGWRWRNHWIYWVGPFIGAAFAGVIYEFGIIEAEEVAPPRHSSHTTHQPLAQEDY